MNQKNEIWVLYMGINPMNVDFKNSHITNWIFNKSLFYLHKASFEFGCVISEVLVGPISDHALIITNCLHGVELDTILQIYSIDDLKRRCPRWYVEINIKIDIFHKAVNLTIILTCLIQSMSNMSLDFNSLLKFAYSIDDDMY